MATDANLPNLLLLSNEIPQSIYAGCILLHRLLKGYPPGKLLVMGPAVNPAATRLDCRYETVKIPLVRLHTTRLAALKRSLDAVGATPGISLRKIDRLLAGFAPDIVLSVMEERHYLAASRFARLRGLPLVLIVHDKPELFDQVYKWAKGAQIRVNSRIYRAAAVRFCVSPEMEEHLRKIYGAPGDVLYPNRSDELAPLAAEQSSTLRRPPLFHIGYAGTLAYGYGSQLRRLATALRGTQIRLRIYGNVDPTDILRTEQADVVECRGLFTPPERAWEAVKAECDSVVLPYSWRSETDPTDLYRTHFPSKLTEYLALGMPVVAMGPDYATGIRWALRNPDATLTLTVDQPEAWVAALEELRASPERRVALARGALEAGKRDFDPEMIRRKFINTIRSVAAGTPQSG